MAEFLSEMRKSPHIIHESKSLPSNSNLILCRYSFRNRNREIKFDCK